MNKDNKYKINLCKNIKDYGKCKYGDKCRYAHSRQELRCFYDENCMNNNCERIHENRDKNKENNLKEDTYEINEINNNDDKEKRVSYSNIFKNQNKIDNLNNEKENKNTDISINVEINNNSINNDYTNKKAKENNNILMDNVNELKSIFEKNEKDIKLFINNKVKNNNIKYELFKMYNEIKTEIQYFENSIEDIIKLNIKE